MRIYVKVLKGSECPVTISSSSSILDVKQQLHSLVSIPVNQQKLIYQGKALADEKSLSHYHISDGCRLFLLLKKPDSSTTESPCSSSELERRLQVTEMAPVAVDNEDSDTNIFADDPTGFWHKLSVFLQRHFTKKDAHKVLVYFKKDFDKGLRNLSLDDIERLASTRLYTNSSQTQALC